MKILDILGDPWAIPIDKLFEIRNIYDTHLKGEKIDFKAIEAKINPLGGGSPRPQGYDLVGNVAVLDIEGPLVKSGSILVFLLGGANTDDIAAAFERALSDPQVQSILLHIDSPGGTVRGVQELAAQIYNARGLKPIITWSDGMLTSAAYWVGAAADKIYISGETNVVGSIGVVFFHLDLSQPGETPFYAGRYKPVDTGGKLTSEGSQVLQDRVDYIYGILTADIAKLRGVPAETVRNNMADGRIFIGQQAVEAGLVDGIATRESVISGMAIGNIPLANALEGSERKLRLVKKGNASALVDEEVLVKAADLAGLANAKPSAPVKPDFEALVLEHMKKKSCSKGAAIQAMAKEHPEEHRAFIERVNDGN